MSIRIAHLNLAPGFRGGERQTELLIRALAEAGVSQVLVCRRGGTLAIRARAIPALQIIPVAGLLSASLALPAADLVHAHEGRCVYAAWLRHAATGVPYVITRRVPNPIRSNWLSHRVYRGAARVVGISADICARLTAYDPALRVECISSVASELPVDPAAVARLRRQAGAGALVVGHVGALDNDHKGQEYLIAAARGLAATHPDMRFVLVGSGPDEQWLRSLAAGLHNVEFTGFVDNVGDYLASFDLFVLPSNREGLGSILIDAMQFGLPIIASRVGGIPELVRDGDNGLLVEPGDVNGLTAALRRLHDAPAERERMATRSRALAAGFTPAAMARQYLALYASILGRELG